MSKKALMAISILLRRYPAAILLIVLNTIFTIWAIGAEKDASRLPLSLLYSSGLAIVFSAAGRLVADRFALKERVTLGVQVLVLLVFAALAWMFHDYGCFEEHFHYSYYLTLAAFSALTAIAMSLRENPETVFPKLTFAGMMGFVAAIAMGGGVALTVLAVEKLFGVKISYTVYEMVWGASFATVASGFFLAYATREEEFTYPKVWKVLVAYVSFPVYLLLLAVLWAYLGKCVLTWKLPNGQINWLVTTASVMWMVFHLVLGGVEIAIVRLFRRVGAALIVPLVGLQVVALWIRISEYGLTPSRYASVVFVAFVVLFAFGTLVRRTFSQRVGYALFAAVALFAAHSHWNVVDVGVRAQKARLAEYVRQKSAGVEFDQNTRYSIMSAYEFICRYNDVNGRHREVKQGLEKEERDRFKNEWGFSFIPRWEREHSKDAGNRRHFNFWLKDRSEVAVDGFRTLRRCRIKRLDGEVVIEDASRDVKLGWKDEKITESLKTALSGTNSPDRIEFGLPNGSRVVIIDVSFDIKGTPGRDEELYYATGSCYILSK